MADAGALEISDVASRRRERDDLVAGVGERAELRTEQQFEAHVGRCHVDKSRSYSAHLSHTLRPAYRARSRSSRSAPSSAIPPAALRRNQRSPSATWIGERWRRYGSVFPYGLGR